MSISQNNRLIRISASFAADDTFATELHVSEAFSEPFFINLTVLSAHQDLSSEKVIGQKCSVSLHYNPDNEPRHFHGRVLAMTLGNLEGTLRQYNLQLTSGFWFARHSRRQRIFENMKAIDIIQQTLADYGDACPFENKTSGTYLKREYCVQYDESDFDFLVRLMAEEGISYHFRHSADRHVMVLCDSTSGYGDCDEREVRLNVGSDMAPDARVLSWQRNLHYHASGVEMADYCHNTPKNFHAQSLASHSTFAQTLGPGKLKDFHGFNFTLKSAPDHDFDVADNKKLNQIRMESLETGHEIASGDSYCGSFFAGGRFKLQHPIGSETGSYVLTRVQHVASNRNDEAAVYQNHFTCIPDKRVFRPPQSNCKHHVRGPHSAVVVNLNASESKDDADPHRMVKVKFPWADQANSCWLRVAQLYAGPSWGASFVPRIGQEVLVDFINGDPDRPLVVGALYNKDNKGPAYTSTQSGIKTESSHFNELRFDDKDGAEEVYLEAGKDFNFLVNNDETGTILNNQVLEVKKDRKATIGGDCTQDVTGNISQSAQQSIKVKAGQSISLQANVSIELKVGGNSIKIDQSGVTISGTLVKVNGDAMTEVKGGGMLKLQGGLVMVN